MLHPTYQQVGSQVQSYNATKRIKIHKNVSQNRPSFYFMPYAAASIGRKHNALTTVVCLSVCHVPYLTRERKGVGSSNLTNRKPVTHAIQDAIDGLKGQRLRSLGRFAVTENDPYLRNWEADELQTWYTDDPHHRHAQ